MKHGIAMVVALGVLSVAGCGEKSEADASTQNSQVIAGGWSETEAADKDIQAAAEFAVQQMSQTGGKPLKLKKILSAQKQVVAGMNYNLVLLVADGATDRQAEVVVWRKLDNTSALTSFKWR